ncbi:PrsW family intramembrane metalloprotease [Sporosarcina sp. P21c]|uniref:glutamic-type intramembrane protease PrsW n=1 Tax=unclassified Sporosarcina TaxID=2647733 RepID=UPI000C166A9A|nr:MULTISPECIES: glutamic-type intramembrane protease PrsW [unclassified Sporosarcina]PIC68625.1 PrsW family intramembrane metalloprotease [Sporosarcina sp. P16a]PIC84601.1 PrsW family intramembrane metalloprotease [Sporosarcina sp. P1]PIC91189.1 PrsW family intramembrane metalloprotease [Sporosarcina sp. P21c]PIC93678.1 PrsW family intramembrane metalloprotease [Sporosarcina sp. P25]
MFILLTVAIAPALALFSYLYLRKQIAKEPSKTLFHAFIYGAIMTFPILFIQHVFEEEHVFHNEFFRNVLFTSSLEEFFKWIIIFILVYKTIEFEDAYDGILYGASVSLGFATIENILYLLSFGLNTAFLRALLPVSSHALFGVVMGYYFGKAKFSVASEKAKWIVIAFLAPLLLHIFYNSILFTNDYWLYLMIPFMLFLWWFGLTRVKYAHTFAMQQFRKRNQSNF